MLKLYKRTIIVSIWIFLILFVSSIILKIVFPRDDTISFLQNYIIGITCSILVVIITTFLQYKSEYEKAIAEITTVSRQLLLNLWVALSYQEKNVEEIYCENIIKNIKEDCDKLNQINKSFCCFRKKIFNKYLELAKIVLKLYLPLISNSDDSHYDMIKKNINYPIYIELAQKINGFIDDDLNKQIIDELIKDAHQILEEKKHIKKSP